MDGIFRTIIEMSFKASVVIVAVLLARLVLTKAPRKFSYMLWAVAGFRLCVPQSFSLGLSIFSLNRQNEIADAANTVGIDTTVTVIGNNASNEAVQNTVNNASNAISATAQHSFDWGTFLLNTAMVIWIIGVLVMVIYGIVSYLKIHSRMSNAILQKENIYFSDRISAPFTLGFFSPKIYLPFGLNETEANCIVAHEKCHIKRLDHIVKLLGYILLSVHWFNPLCWIAFNRMSLDMEMSCDEIIFRKENSSEMKKDYTKALVSIASKKRFPSPTPITFDDGRNTKKRVKNILNFKKQKIWINILCYALCLFMLVACSADAENINIESVGNETFGDLPYNIIYTSDGEGSCTVSEIRIDRDYSGDIHLIIPEKTAEGDTVTAIDWNGFNGNLTLNIPMYLTSAQLESIVERVNDALDERSAKIVKAFYGKSEKSGTVYYVLEPKISPEEKERLCNILTNSGYTVQNCLQDTQDFMHRIPETAEELKLFENNAYSFLYRNGNRITEITVPETVKYISTYAFYGCPNLKKVNGIAEDCVVNSEVINAFDKKLLTISLSVLDEDESLEQVDGYHQYNAQGEGWQIVIKPSKTIKNFKFLAMDEAEALKVSETLFEVEELSPAIPFLAHAQINDATISHGISFTDENGATRYYAIIFNASGEGEELKLKEVSF